MIIVKAGNDMSLGVKSPNNFPLSDIDGVNYHFNGYKKRDMNIKKYRIHLQFIINLNLNNSDSDVKTWQNNFPVAQDSIILSFMRDKYDLFIK